MTLEAISLDGYNSGVQKDKKPFLLGDDAFVTLENAFTWRGRIQKRPGLQLIGRLRRLLPDATIGNTGATRWTFNLYTVYGITPESSAEIEPGSVVITIAGPIVLTDQGNGLITSPTAGNRGFINYLTGDVSITHTAGAGVATTATFAYFPSLPAMGIFPRERADINDEQTIFFDTKYAYNHNGTDFVEFITGTTWASTNSDFFWCTNYRGSEASERLFFETNFISDANNPMRYTNATTWTNFQPILSGTAITETVGTLINPWAVFNGNLLTFPIIEGSVVITVGAIIFRDNVTPGTLTSSGTNTGTINYITGAIVLNFVPALVIDTTVIANYDQDATFLFTARILLPYYGRLIALNTYEGTVKPGSNFFSRARFSQVGSPIQDMSWRSDVFGRGGFIDAPTNEEIISARYYKNVLIVFFEKSTWRLQYIGEYGTPFIWERISSDWGSESPFSTILFDNGVLSVGDKAIVSSSGNDVQRIDSQIPDKVYDFKNTDNGKVRVHGVRDFRKEVVYWCYPDYSSLREDQIYPNYSLLYNYRNNSFSFFRNTVTCFGEFLYPTGITWDRLDIFWDDYNVFWDDSIQEGFPTIASGNQQGFIHFYTSPDSEASLDSTINANDQESLTVINVTVGATVSLTITDHNLQNGEWIYLTGLIYIVTTDLNNPTVGSTTLNDKIYNVQVTDKDTIVLFAWSETLKQLYSNFTVTNTGSYVGGGVVALFPRLNIKTKDFNPAKQVGQNIQTSYIDFLIDSTPNSVISINLLMNSSNNANANMITGNQQLEISNFLNGNITNVTLANPCVITSPNHGLLSGNQILIQSILDTTQLNGNQYIVVFIDVNRFSLNVDSSGYTAYISSGQWIQTSNPFYTPDTEYSWYRFFANAYGQYVALQITYDNELMSQLSTHQSDFVLNAMKLYFRAAGNNIFGK